MTARDHPVPTERRLGVGLLLISIVGVPIWAMFYPFFAMGGVVGLIVFIAPPTGLAGASIVLLMRTRHDDVRPAETRTDRPSLWNLTPHDAAATLAGHNEKN